MSQPKLTPMLQQYMAVKEQYPDCLIFFRLGDFYEMFFDDALVGARELDLTLTTRDRNKPPEERTPMCGVPHHAVQSYLSKLTAKGYKVVLCDQMEDPAQAKGLVERDVVRIITPGTVVEPDALREDDNNFLCGLAQGEGWIGLCFCDLSTGQTQAMAVASPGELTRLYSAVDSYRPREVVFSPAGWDNWQAELRSRLGCHCERGDEESFDPAAGAKLLSAQFDLQEGEPPRGAALLALQSAVGGLLNYLYQTQRTRHLPHLQTITYPTDRTYMDLDRATRRNLELTETMLGKDRRGSLLWVMDRCKTPMGRRRLRAWLERPLLDVDKINARLDAVAFFVDQPQVREELRRALARTGDPERLVARLATGGGGARELLALAEALEHAPEAVRVLDQAQPSLIRVLADALADLSDLTGEVRRAIRSEDLPATVREGGIIAPGYHPQVDHYQSLLQDGGQAILDIAETERQRTGIKNLKVKYNKVFGYYIEISNAYKGPIPEDYIRRQTLVNGERYVTPRLKELEEEILNARELDGQLEYDLFCALRSRVVEQSARIQATAEALAQLDVLSGLAVLAAEERYVRPVVDGSKDLDIRDGRHPVVEKTLPDGIFVPNDAQLNGTDRMLCIITGPNMAGKSTYMRQVGLIVLMAQMGSFVPAKSARIGVVDGVYTRIGAADDLSGGRSTFMVEMMEVAHILNTATDRSLILLDEVGRGTSTYDGQAIARAVMEYCIQPVGAKTLFSTHYHALANLAPGTQGAFCCNVAAEKRGDSVVFLRKILPGMSSKSYGIEVSRLAGLPVQALERGARYLQEIELAEERSRQGLRPEEPAVVQTPEGPVRTDPQMEELVRQMERTQSGQEHPADAAFRFLPKDPFLIKHTYVLAMPMLTWLDDNDLDNVSPKEAWELLREWQERMKGGGWRWDWP